MNFLKGALATRSYLRIAKSALKLEPNPQPERLATKSSRWKPPVVSPLSRPVLFSQAPSNNIKVASHHISIFGISSLVERALLYLCLPKVAFFSFLQPANISRYTLQLAANACANHEMPFSPPAQRPLSQSSGFTFGLEEAEDIVFADCEGNLLACV